MFKRMLLKDKLLAVLIIQNLQKLNFSMAEGKA